MSNNIVPFTGKWGTIGSGLFKRLLRQRYNLKTSTYYYPFGISRETNKRIIGIFHPSLFTLASSTTNDISTLEDCVCHFENDTGTNMASVISPLLQPTCDTILNLINKTFLNATHGFLNAYLSATQVPSERTKLRKQQRGRMKGISCQGNQISFGTYGLQALEPAWITSQQIEAGRIAIVRNAGRGGKIWVRVFPDKPVTARPAETRMGKGKGALECWVAVVKPGRILYEMSGVSETVARKAILVAASKMPIRTQFLTSG